MKAPNVLTGMFGEFGEFVVIGELRKLGFHTDWDGGLTVGGDVRAERSDRRLWFQVKSSTLDDGRIAYSSPPRNSQSGKRTRMPRTENRGSRWCTFRPPHDSLSVDPG